ncbi:MAG: HPF/RaiA family ribosome-associated protein [Desulfobacterales bacterium]|nr:HPF/RaiA family ribosome-associated protein [Desulfobacterales bacterium]
MRRLITLFDPPGCASKSLPECLLAQVAEEPAEREAAPADPRPPRGPVALQLRGHRPAPGHRHATRCWTLAARLKRLTPHPAEAFDREEVEYAEVDLMLIKENGEYRVMYLDEGLPRLTLSKYYQEMLEKTGDKKTVSYLKSRYRDAQFFIESIELRKKTILRIAEYLVKAQKDFLDFGEKWKKPLTMKDVAREVNLNESTISRAMSNKFMTSEKGIIPLKVFLSYGLKGDFGFSHAVGTIKDKIRELIAGEAAGEAAGRRRDRRPPGRPGHPHRPAHRAQLPRGAEHRRVPSSGRKKIKSKEPSMSINFATKNVKMPGAIKAYVEKHLLDIEKIAGEIIDAEVIVNEEKLSFKVEISLKTRLHSFYAEDRNKILKQAVRNTLATLKSQAKRSKEKIKEEKKRAGAKGISMATVGLVPDERSRAR